MLEPGGDASQTLLARAREGDQRALGELLVRNLPQLEAYLRLQAGPAVRSKESLSDLVQSVCVDVLRDLTRFEFRGEAQFRHWLGKHALHKVINKREYYGAAKRDMAREDCRGEAGQGMADSSAAEADSVLRSYGTICTPSRVASGREQLRRFESAFDRLSDDCRQAITLHRIIGIGYAEIAASMHRSENAVRNLVHRGLSRLSTWLME